METKRSEPRAGINEYADLLREVVGALVWHPKDIKIDIFGEREGEEITILEFDPHVSDYGIVVGKAGRQIQALRTVFQYIAHRRKIQLRLILKERARIANQEPPPAFIPDPEWMPDRAVALLQKVLGYMLTNPPRIAVISTKDQTTLEITAAPEEQKIVIAYKPYLHTIFHAVGKAQGHHLYIEAPQPMPSVR